MGMSSGGDNNGMMAEINVTPFVDVMLVLLIIFMVTAPMMNQGVQVQLPKATAEQLPTDEKALILSISQKGEYFMAEEDYELGELKMKLQAIAAANPARATTDLNGNQTQEKIGFLTNIIRRTIIGLEVFPEKGFNIRAGYSFRRAEELRIIEQRNFSGLSFGIGLKFNNLRFSYTHARFSAASNTSFLGVQISL